MKILDNPLHITDLSSVGQLCDLGHPWIWSYAELLKLGRINGTVEFDRLIERVNEYAKVIHQPAIPGQFVVPLFSHFKKARYYNSGEGTAVAGVPRRASLHIQGRLRLHERWLIVMTELEGSVVDANLRPDQRSLYALLALDCGSQQPMGCLVVPHTPTVADVGLVLHQSIWHEAALDWPLRGIPEKIVVSKDFKCAKDIDLSNAAEFLMAQLELDANARIELRALPRARALLQAMRVVLKEKPAPLTLAEAQAAIQGWLHTSCFQHHISDSVPKHLRDHGVALPGYDTPTAGWLFPRVELVETQRDGVIIGHREYTNPQAGIEPGQPAWLRMNPKQYQIAVPYVFIEIEQDIGRTVHCLFRQARL